MDLHERLVLAALRRGIDSDVRALSAATCLPECRVMQAVQLLAPDGVVRWGAGGYRLVERKADATQHVADQLRQVVDRQPP